jgi:hypothetical protein
MKLITSGSWIKLYMFPLTFNEFFSPCINNDHGLSQRSVNMTIVPADSSFFKRPWHLYQNLRLLSPVYPCNLRYIGVLEHDGVIS